MCLVLFHGRRHQVRNHGRRTLDIDVHRPYLYQLHHHHCSLDKFSCVPHVDANNPLPESLIYRLARFRPLFCPSA